MAGQPNTARLSEAAIRAAIEAADRQAGADDAAFARVLNQHVERARGGGARTRGVATTGSPPKSFRVHSDPRYLANARALARRTLGGLRVIGGARVPVGEFLDCVAVGSDSQWGCTGTLIASNTVLTAGHCSECATRVYFGSDVSEPGKIVRVKKRFRHPQYHQGKHHDLLVLVLEEKITSVAPRKFATKALLDKATDGRVVGFGNTDAAGTFGYGTKRFVDVPIASPACKGTIDDEDDNVTYGCDAGLELVAGRPMLEQDSCNGDSGGPFYVLDKQEQWVLGAATSRATDSAVNNCGDGGIYVRVDRYRSWIDDIPGVTLP